MRHTSRQDAILLLADGTEFRGKAIGAIGTTTGEICFNTGMTGYQEVFTDPSYHGQVLVMATAHIGNYGTHNEEVESNSTKISGLVVKKFSEIHSRPSSDLSLEEFLVRDGVTGICDVDTRAVVRHIREHGAQNCIISSETLEVEELKKQLELVPSMQGLELSSKVTTKEPYTMGDENATLRVALIDLGVKLNIARCMVDRGAFVRIFPMDTPASEIMAWEPTGILFSNGPGDPAAMPETIALAKQLIASDTPVFGICLGHQVMALSQGLKTEKMHNGHRGINHPVKNLETGKCEITSQNHGFVVSWDEAEAHDNVKITHQHLNDQSLAGLRLKDRKVFSVQFHPEASAGPHDSRYLFDQFVENMVSAKKLAVKE